MEKVVLLLARKAETPASEIGPSLVAELARIREQGFDVTSGALVSTGLGAAHDEMMSEAPAVDAVFEVATAAGEPAELPEATELLPVIEGFAHRCAAWLDAERSAAVLGTEYLIVEGDEPVRMALALSRWPSLTREQFQDYWLHRHTLIGQRLLPDLGGYSQVHADADLSQQAASAAGVGRSDFEGVAFGCWRDEDTFETFMARADVMDRFLEDERKFIDHDRSGVIVGRSPELTSQPPAAVGA